MSEPSLSFAARFFFAWQCFFRVLFDGAFAGRAWAVRDHAPELPPPPPPAAVAENAPPAAEKPAPKPAPRTAPAPIVAPPSDAALQLLALLQREGRFVDFLEQDIATFPDADVGAAARVVHEGCRKAIHAHAKIAPIRSEEEGTRVTLAAGFSPAEVKLSGNVAGSAPYSGVLRHRGWRASDLSLAMPLEGHDAAVLAPAEVEL